MYSRRSKKDQKKEQKPLGYIPTKHVKGLVHNNFSQYLDAKDIAMVMFYHPECQNCNQAKPHYMKVANTLNNRRRGFASVDCTSDRNLCDKEGIRSFPTFKLYVGGKFVNKFDEIPNAERLMTYVRNAPHKVNDEL